MRRGFTFIEVIAAIAILGTLLAIAVPVYVRARSVANERAVVGTMRALYYGQAVHLSERDAFGTLDELATLGYVDLGAPPGPSVTFTRTFYDWEFAVTSDRQSWTARARPETYGATGRNCYYADSRGVIRFADGSSGGFAAGPSSPAIR